MGLDRKEWQQDPSGLSARAAQEMDYSKTLNLPQTEFPMKAGLPRKEPLILEKWEQVELFQKMGRLRKDAPAFVLHDGPPYANGNIHMGTALNKVLKDMINRYKFMKGFHVPYVPGWDTHGLPVEHQVIKTRQVDRKKVSDLEFRRMCHDYALHYLDVQREQFKRLGVFGDWENPYVTLKPSFEARQVGVFGEMAKKGFIYKGLKPVYWCSQCETALAEAEVEYMEKRSPSIYVKFPVVDARNKWGNNCEPAYVLIWTTTPWTIPANMAIALHPEEEYLLVKSGTEYHLLAREMVEHVETETKARLGEVCASFQGTELEGIICQHPLYQRQSPIVLADYVSMDQGTGCVHTAPGHGQDDYETGLQYELPVFAPLDEKGFFTEAAGEFSGLSFSEGNKAVTQALEREQALLNLSFISHQYPHCWRCKKEVIFRATEQWFASIQKFRAEALQAVQDVHWIPAWGEGRMKNMIVDRRDWCISRQRVWGVPLPIFYCDECDETILNETSITAVQEIFAREGSDAWFKYDAKDILPPGYRCDHCGSDAFRKEKDIMDVWFDSGSSHAAVLEVREDLTWPADLYLEGSDQFRGWFQSSLLTAVATRGKPPFKSVLSHGWVVDGDGRKMSKSLGNVIAPEEIIEQYGADILRLWVSSADFTSDIHLSSGIIKQLTEVYRKIRNTCRFLMGNLHDFNPAKDAVAYSQLEEIDRLILHRLKKLTDRTDQSFKHYEFHQVFHAVHNFTVVDLSNFYMDVLKDRLYVLEADAPSRRAAQTVLAELLQVLTCLIAPVLPFTADEIYAHIPYQEDESVILSKWPVLPEEYLDEELAQRWEVLRELRDEVNRVLEKARRDKTIGNSLQAHVDLFPGPDLYARLQPYDSQLASIFIVSSCRLHEPTSPPGEQAERARNLDLQLAVKKAAGEKCTRCWMYCPSVEQAQKYPEICRRCAAILDKMEA